jgi:hypothetical protein
MTDDEIRLFNEIMQNQSGEQTEDLASRFPSVYEVPSVSKPDPNAEKLKQILEGRKQLEEKQRQEEFAARPLPEKIEGAREAAGFLGSTIGRGMTYPFVELYGRATDQPSLGSEYLEGAELPKTDLGLEYTIRTGEALEPLATAMDVAKIPHTPFTPELLPLANMPFALSKLNVARASQKAVEDVREAGKAASQVGRKAADIVEKGVETVQETLATPPVGAISLDALGFSSRLSEGVDKLQDKGTGPQFLAQLSKMKGVPQAEIKVTGLDEYLKNTPKVTKQEVQDYLETNRLQLIEDERIAGAGRLSKEQVNTLPSEFDWLDREDLNEGFENKAHLRNHLIVTLNRHFDDLELQAADTGSFYARDRSGEVRYIPESRKFQWLDSEQDRIDEVLSELPDFNSATKYPDEYLIPGGENYREILYKIPDDKVEGVFRSPHFDNADNTFGSIRATDRIIDGTPTLFAEEIQSDWAIRGAKGGYGPQPMPDVDAETLRTTPDIEYRLSPDQKVFLEDLAIENDIAYFSPKSEERTKEIQRLQKKYDDWKATEKIKGSVPDNPFRGNWYKPVINNFLVKAAKEGKGGIGFPVGEIVKDRYNLANVVDRIESYTDDYTVELYTPAPGGPFKYVTIDLKPALNDANKKQMRLTVDKDGLVWETNAGQYNRFIGKPLTEVVGKGVSEKILSNDSQVMTDLDLKIGGEGKDKLYNDMLPKHLNEIGKRYGVQLEKRTTSSADVYFMPITEEMRNDILSQGLPIFKQGGSVKKFAPGGTIKSAIAGAGRAAKEVSKANRRQERVNKNLQSYVSGSKLVDAEGKPLSAYHGRQSIPFTVFDKSKIGSNTRQGNDAFWFTTNPNVAETFRSYGRRDVDYGSQINIDRILKKLQEDGGQSHPVKNYDVALGQDGSSVWARLISGPENKRQWTQVGVLGKDADAGLSQWAESVNKTPIRDADSLVEAYLRAQNPLEINFEGKLKTEPWFEMVREAQRQGRDSVIFKNVIDTQTSLSERKTDPEYLSDIYGVFSPTQIKSAIGNRGSFDPNDPDITKAKGGPIKSALEGVGKAAAEVKKTGKLTRLQKELRERGGEKQAQRLERAADEIPGLERLFHSRGLIEAFQGSEGFPYQGVVTMRPGDYKNFSQPLEVDLSEGRQGISPYSVQNIEDLRELIRRGRPFTSVPYLQLDKKGPLTIVSGHEGRHRTRAMEAEDIPATLVQVLPRHSLKFKDLRNPSPSEWRQKLSEAMGPEGLVLPEGGMKLNPKFARASELAKKASEERDWDKFGALDRELSRYHKEDKVKLPDLEMLTEFPEVYQKGGAVKSMVSNTHIAPSDVVERTQLKKKGGLACLSK